MQSFSADGGGNSLQLIQHQKWVFPRQDQLPVRRRAPQPQLNNFLVGLYPLNEVPCLPGGTRRTSTMRSAATRQGQLGRTCSARSSLSHLHKLLGSGGGQTRSQNMGSARVAQWGSEIVRLCMSPQEWLRGHRDQTAEQSSNTRDMSHNNGMANVRVRTARVRRFEKERT